MSVPRRRPPPDGLDAPASQSAGKTVREGNAQIPPVQLDLLDPASEQSGFKAPPDGFDLGQLRHDDVMAGLCRVIQCFLDRLEC